jgi:hypothetical protein
VLGGDHDDTIDTIRTVLRQFVRGLQDLDIGDLFRREPVDATVGEIRMGAPSIT